MKKIDELWIYGLSALAFGFVCITSDDYASRLMFFGWQIGLIAIILAAVTILVNLFGSRKIKRWCYYIHSGFLATIGLLGLLNMIKGDPNLLWVFCISQYCQIIFSVRRGDLIG